MIDEILLCNNIVEIETSYFFSQLLSTRAMNISLTIQKSKLKYF